MLAGSLPSPSKHGTDTEHFACYVMPEQPPKELAAQLERLGLATAAQLAAVGWRVKRLAKDLPQFDSVWIDALAQARVLTAFQAAQLNAGQGDSLRAGQYVLCERLAHPYYVASYRARHVDTNEIVRVAVAEINRSQTEETFQQSQRSLPPPLFVSPWLDGRTAAALMVHGGRFPPEVVLEIARLMLAELVALEQKGTCHGDVGLASLFLARDGGVVLLFPGLRGSLRPEEGYAHADLAPEAFDGLSPERIAAGTPPNVASDVFACGCAWWHMLCGRSPFAGGNAFVKLRAVQACEIDALNRHVADVPKILGNAIARCLQRDPAGRPSMAQLAEMLGPPSPVGKDMLAIWQARAARAPLHWATTVRTVRRSSRTPLWLAAAACCFAVAVALLWPTWRGTRGEGRGKSGQWSVASGQREVESRERRVERDETRASRKDSEVDVAANHQSEIINHKSPSSLAPRPSPLTPNRQSPIPNPSSSPAPLVLPSDRPSKLATLDLQPGQCVCGTLGRRATVLVSGDGVAIDKENVRFENIDFVWNGPSGGTVRNASTAIVQLRAGHAEFQGCSFQCQASVSKAAADAVAAIRWVHPDPTAITASSLPTGRIRLVDCTLGRVGAGIDCRTVGAVAIELSNTLYLGAGPLTRLDHCPRADEPLTFDLSRATLRGCGPLLECRLPNTDDRYADEQPGEIAIRSSACVFAPMAGEPLVRLVGDASPMRLLSSLLWTGQGSLVTPNSPIAALRGLDGRQRTIDEATLSISGLVRSSVSFAGQPSADPASSRALRWQAPLPSSDAPGIDPAALK